MCRNQAEFCFGAFISTEHSRCLCCLPSSSCFSPPPYVILHSSGLHPAPEPLARLAFGLIKPCRNCIARLQGKSACSSQVFSWPAAFLRMTNYSKVSELCHNQLTLLTASQFASECSAAMGYKLGASPHP